jgi:hypothetical protein
MTPHFTNFLSKKYGDFITQEVECPMYATAAELETHRKELLAQMGGNPASPLLAVDWIPPGAAPLTGAAAPPAPAAVATRPQAPAPPPAATPAAGSGVRRDRWGQPVLATAYWVCESHLNKTLYMTAPFFAATDSPTVQDIRRSFVDHLVRTYHEGGTSTCNKFATQAEAAQHIEQQSTAAPGTGYRFAKLDWSYAPAAAAKSPANAPTPATNSALMPTRAPAPPAVAVNPASTAPAKPAAARQAAVYVICRSEWNTDSRRFYNPPVDGRGGSYAEWQASYHEYLVKQYAYKGSNFGCGKYPTREAAQADYDSWLAAARATPKINDRDSPIIITNWTY